MTTVFLSAGIPDRPERGDYVETSDPIAIRDAVRALTSVVIDRGQRLVFGGHPAITPLVWQVAEAAGGTDLVSIYQSREYENVIPEEALGFTTISWRHDLREMRSSMIHEHQHDCGVFIGGMDGVKTEFSLFRSARPEALAFPVGSTGGAARGLLESQGARLPTDVRERLSRDLRYRSLFTELLPNANAPSQ